MFWVGVFFVFCFVVFFFFIQSSVCSSWYICLNLSNYFFNQYSGAIYSFQSFTKQNYSFIFVVSCYKSITAVLSFFRPTVLQKDNKLITPRRLCGVLSLALVSWTTCGAFAVFIIYLQYLFKVLKG